MSVFSGYSAESFENAIADSLHDKDLTAAVSLLRIMAVEHPRRAQVVLDSVSGLLDQLHQAVEERTE